MNNKERFIEVVNNPENKLSIVELTNIVEKAIDDYTRLKEIVRYLRDECLINICLKFSGHNFDEYEGLFDLNYGCLCATIKKDKDGNTVLVDNVHVYGDIYGAGDDVIFLLDMKDDFKWLFPIKGEII